ncbi:MAG TPA: thiamine pyrophosphate-binding protein [Thermoanaerobaculia bacterium]|jgi:acetolactate synthase-1/2/3 large subunit|nr:thiamine pyrophosphate-binding protein [Thermoanaerobaculia bacterium]
MNGGDRVAQVLEKQGVRFLFTLCGGHISPILVGAKRLGLRVVDVRHEVDAVFAADAVFRLTGVPGVATVTAGPGVTNTITAVKNAQLAQSAVVILGGAAATLLKGRGALQDIDQMALFEPHVKWAASASAVRDLVPMLEKAFDLARSGVPGPVFLECPVDLLYGEELVREWYGASSKGGGIAGAGMRLYLKRHASKLFAGADKHVPAPPRPIPPPVPERGGVRRAAARLRKAKRPVLVLGGQVLLSSSTPEKARELAAALDSIGAPVYLAGGARGLLGPGHRLQLRHKRKEALREADLVLLAGIPNDFRLDYGRQVSRKAFLISVNRSEADLTMNRKPDLAVHADPGLLLRGLAEALKDGGRWKDWLGALRARDEEREREIDRQAGIEGGRVNPIHLCREIDRTLAPESVIVADGGDFVATAAYTLSPRGPLAWLDPGVFGTLGVGGGFALAAKLCRPEADVWILYGDGSVAYSLAEFDTFARHGLPVIAVVGNDAGWTQIAREQVEVLKDDVGTVLARTDYHKVAEGYGGRGLLLERGGDVRVVLEEAVRLARGGSPVLVNAHLDRTEFRKGSISM